MKLVSKYSMQSNTFGDLVSNIFTISFEHLPRFLLMNVIAFSPVICAAIGIFLSMESIVETTLGAGLVTWKTIFFMLAFMLLVILCGTVYFGAVVKGVSDLYMGNPLDVGDCLGVALKKVLSFFIAGIILYVLIFLVMIGAAIAATILAMMLGGLGNLLGVILMFYLMFKLFISYYLVIPAMVIEDLGAVDAIRRSSNLSRGYGWRIFVILFLVTVVMLILTLVVGKISNVVADIPVLSVLLGYIFNCFGPIVMAVSSVIIYFDIRGQKESFGLEQLAGIFD